MGIKLEHKNRKGLWKIFHEADVEQAKANGWNEIEKKSAPKKSNSKKK